MRPLQRPGQALRVRPQVYGVDPRVRKGIPEAERDRGKGDVGVMDDADMQRPSFRQLYDVTQTPTLYLLDSEKRIVGKKLTVDQLNDLLQVKWNASRK